MKLCGKKENKISYNIQQTDLKCMRIHRRYKLSNIGVHFFGTLCILFALRLQMNVLVNVFYDKFSLHRFIFLLGQMKCLSGSLIPMIFT